MDPVSASVSEVICCGLYEELLGELRKNFHEQNMVFIKNNGTDFPGVPSRSIDFLFSFGTLVHLDVPLIEAYLNNMRDVLRPGGNAVLQYSDKSKIMARMNSGFSDNSPAQMSEMVLKAGFRILEEDLTTLGHSV